MIAKSGKIDGVVYPSNEVIERYQSLGILGTETVAAALRAACAKFGSSTALVHGDQRISYRELDEVSDRVAAALLRRGLRPLDRVLFQIGNVPEIFTLLYGCFKADIIPVCTLPTHRESELEFLAQLTGARGYFFQTTFRNKPLLPLAQTVLSRCPEIAVAVSAGGADESGILSYAELIADVDLQAARAELSRVEINPLEVCIFQISGGTTGVPKVIPRMNSEYVYNMRCAAMKAGFDQSTVMLWPLPAIHNAAIGFYNTPTHLSGGTVVLQESHDPNSVLSVVEKERVTFFATVKPIVVRIIESGLLADYDFSSVRSTSSTNCAELMYEHFGTPSFHQFGMSEGMGMRSGPDDPEHLQRTTIGSPLSVHDEVRIVEPGTETLVREGEIGEYCARGPYTFHGYYKASDLNRDAFTSDGFYRSGDLMRAHVVDGRTFYSFEGRIKDNIDRGSEKISAEELERVLKECPAFTASAAVGYPDRIYGERVCACVVVRDGHVTPSVAELGQIFAAQGLAKFKWPERIEVFAALPLTEIGKVDKKALRAELAKRDEAVVSDNHVRAPRPATVATP